MDIIMIDDEPRYRSWLKKSFSNLHNEINVFDFGVDIDFLEHAIPLIKKTPNTDEIVLILDLQLKQISYSHWCKPDTPYNEISNCRFGILKYDDLRIHGLNIYYNIRSLTPHIKIVIVSSFDYSRLQLLTGVKDILANDTRSRYIKRSDAKTDVANIMKFIQL